MFGDVAALLPAFRPFGAPLGLKLPIAEVGAQRFGLASAPALELARLSRHGQNP